MHTVEEVIQAAKALPASDQWRIWDELAGCLKSECEDSASAVDAWRAEVARRSDEIDAGSCRLSSGDAVMNKARTIVGIPQDG